MMFSKSTLIPAFLASVAFAAPAFAQDVEYQIINDSALTLMEFYTSPVGVDSWEDDILGANVLASGASGTVTIADGREQCDYDLLFVFEDGQQLTDSVNICDIASYTLSN